MDERGCIGSKGIVILLMSSEDRAGLGMLMYWRVIVKVATSTAVIVELQVDDDKNGSDECESLRAP